MKLEAVLWDIDGTLIDSEPVHLEALLAVSADHGVDLTDLSDDRFIGVNLGEVWDEIGSRYPAHINRLAWIDAINTRYEGFRENLRSIPKAREVVLALHELGLRQAAVSNSNRRIVDINIEALQIGKYLDFSISLDDVSAPKPDPAPYWIALDRLDLRPEQAIAVEDSQTGAASARAAGLRVLSYQNERCFSDKVLTCLGEIRPFIMAEYRNGLQD